MKFVSSLSMGMLALCCATGAFAEEAVVPLNNVVAIVNTSVVTSDELYSATDQTISQAKAQGVTVPDELTLQRQVLQGLIMQKIALQLASLNHITISDEAVDAAISQIAAQNHVSDAALYAKLEASGVTRAAYRTNIRTQLIVQQLEQQAVSSAIVITPEQISNYLARQARLNNVNTEYDLAHILLAYPANPTQADHTRLYAQAEQIIAKIKAGLSFTDAVKTYSASDDAATGGDLGYKTLDQLPTAFVEPASAMQVGEISAPIATDTGYSILKLIDKKGGSKVVAGPHYITEYHVEAILMKTSPIMNDEAVQAALQRLVLALNNGASFAGLAEANSQDYFTSKNGGDMGWLNPAKLDPTLAARVANTPVGQLSVPFKTSEGWYLIQVLGARQTNDTQSYDEHQAEQALFMERANQAVMAWQAQIKSASYIKILDPNLAPPDVTSSS